LAAHAEEHTLAAFLFFAFRHQRPVHVCHVSRKEEILMIKDAKEKGIRVTCEVAPHHLFLTEEDEKSIGPGRSEVRPSLATPDDQQALWDNLDVIDCFASDHAPHLLSEKDSDQPPPGFPGIETTLPLLLTAVREGRLQIDDIIEKMYTNPRRIFSLPEQEETWVEIDETYKYVLKGSEMCTKARWTPFEGKQVQGQVIEVVIRGQPVYKDRELLVEPGVGHNVRSMM
jgi:carbamoyl-phosphate synthase/aspartate carbamoyltransferase/dihydroorotase